MKFATYSHNVSIFILIILISCNFIFNLLVIFFILSFISPVFIFLATIPAV